MALLSRRNIYQRDRADGRLSQRRPQQHGRVSPERRRLCAAIDRPICRKHRPGHTPLPGAFATPDYADISLASSMANATHELVSTRLNLDLTTMRRMAQTKTPVPPVQAGG